MRLPVVPNINSVLSPIMQSVNALTLCNVLCRLKHPLTMSLAERESEILKFETQEREDKHETMRILKFLITLQFHLINGSK